MTNIAGKSASELVGSMQRGELESRAVTEFFINRIEDVNPKLNAVVLKFFDEALEKATAADALAREGRATGRLHGLPFTIKECFDYPGTPSTLGVLARRDDRPAAPDLYVGALMNEGGIVLGKTNVPQLLIFIESENRVYGRTNNPFNDKFGSGGSSGGEGAIVGAGASPIGLGSDIGGSVRFPAAFCGACSIKPTSKRFPDLTRYGETRLEGPITSSAGVIAQHAEDLDLFLRVIDDAAPKADGAESLKSFRDVDVSKIRVGYYDDDGLFPTMPAIKRAVAEAADKLRAAGAEVVKFTPPDLERCEEIFYRIMSVDNARLFSSVLAGEKPLPQLKNMFLLAEASKMKRRLIASGARLFGQKGLSRIEPFFGEPLERISHWAKEVADYKRCFLEAMQRENIDAILGPVAALPAFPHRSTEFIGLGGTYTMLYNVLGFPAGVAQISNVREDEAVGRNAGIDLTMRAAAKAEKISAGLPLAVQIAARPWREDIVIALVDRLHRRNFA